VTSIKVAPGTGSTLAPRRRLRAPQTEMRSQMKTRPAIMAPPATTSAGRRRTLAWLVFVRRLLACATLLSTSLALAQQPPPGAYVTEGGWGTLAIEQDGGFSLDSLGANGHSCALAGRIVGGRAVLEEGCIVAFVRKGPGLHVSPEGASDATRDACRSYCGMRASFEGDYLPQRPDCRAQAVETQRNAFLADYKARRYQAAAGRLEKMLDACGKFLWWMTDAEVRNDLALAQYRAGRPQACVATLEPLQRLLESDAYFPPMEQDWADGMVPRIRFNRDLCTGKLPNKQR
jgi:hypothetical protein